MNIHEIRNAILPWPSCISWIPWNSLVSSRLLNIHEISPAYHTSFIHETISSMLLSGYHRKKTLTFYPFQLPGLVPVLSICNLQYGGIFLQNGENNFVYIRFQINVHTLNFLKFCHKLKRKKKEKQMRFKNFIHFQHPQKFLNLHLHAVMNFKILCAMKTIIKRYMYKNDKKVNLIL